MDEPDKDLRLPYDRVAMRGKSRHGVRGFVVLGPVDAVRRFRPTVAHGVILASGAIELRGGELRFSDLPKIEHWESEGASRRGDGGRHV